MAIGKQIRKYRKALGWKLWQLSDASGVDVGTISALEQRDSKKSDYFLPIAAGLGLTLEQLADEAATHTPRPSASVPKDAGGAVVAMERTPYLPKAGEISDPYINEAIRMLAKMSEADRRATLAAMRMFVANLDPPRDGQALSVAGD